MALTPVAVKPVEQISRITETYSKRIPKRITLTQAISTIAVAPSFTALVAQFTDGYSDMKIVVSGTSIVLGSGAGLQLQITDCDFGGTSGFLPLAVNSSLTANPLPITALAGTGGTSSVPAMAIIQFPTGQIGGFIIISLNCTAAYTSGTLNIDITLS